MSDLEILLSEITPYTGLLTYWKERAKLLPKKDENINFVDFDDTIFSRKKQLENKELRENRGGKGIALIINDMTIQDFIQRYYENTSFPKDIIALLDIKRDVFLTAWVFELQRAKLIACHLDNYQAIITNSWEEKIVELIRHILYKYSFIPSSITMYEDRPEVFIKYRYLIEWVLWTTLIIKKVIMKDNSEYESIETI